MCSLFRSRPQGGPFITLNGPENNTVYTKDAQGAKTPRYIIDKLKNERKIYRILPDGKRTPIGTIEISSVRGVTHVWVGDWELSFSRQWYGAEYRVFVRTHMGQMYWAPTGIIGEAMVLKDSQRRTLARYNTSSISWGNRDLEIFVEADDTLIDLIVVCAVALKGRRA